MKKILYVYKTTNIINNKLYIGIHKGYINDEYLGSGKILKRAIKKYGKENFKKEILEICDSLTILFEREKQYIIKFNSKYPSGYNITDGGEWGDTFTNNPNKEVIRQKISEKSAGNKNGFYGKSHTKETLDKIKQKRKLYYKTNKSPTFNTTVIHNPVTNEQKHISINDEIPSDWVNGILPTYIKNYKGSLNKKWISNVYGEVRYIEDSDEIPEGWFLGFVKGPKFHSEETKLKMKNSALGKKGTTSNRKWITNGIENKLHQEEKELPLHWWYGRTKKLSIT